MRQLLSSTALFILVSVSALSGATISQAKGFYVIPVPVSVGSCGIPVGAKAFVLDIGDVPETVIGIGDVLVTTTGKLILITGGGVWYSRGENFLVAPNSLPEPGYGGVKGPYYYLHNGNIAYAKYL